MSFKNTGHHENQRPCIYPATYRDRSLSGLSTDQYALKNRNFYCGCLNCFCAHHEVSQVWCLAGIFSSSLHPIILPRPHSSPRNQPARNAVQSIDRLAMESGRTTPPTLATASSRDSNQTLNDRPTGSVPGSEISFFFFMLLSLLPASPRLAGDTCERASRPRPTAARSSVPSS